MMKLWFFLSFLFWTSSCQGNFSLSQWFGQLKDQGLTYFASRATENKLSAKDRQEFLYLFGDLSSASSCSQVRASIEGNTSLQFFEREFHLPKGFLFDEFLDYDYEEALLQAQREPSAEVAFSLVSVWKTELSLEEIEPIIKKVRICYPDEYLET